MVRLFPNRTLPLHFADTLLTEGQLSLGHRHLKVRDVTVPRVPRFQSEMNFRCLSPIVMSTVREWDGKQAMHYCMPDDPELSDLIRQNLIRKHEAIHGSAPHDDTLTFRFDTDYINRINRRQGRVTRLVDYKGIKIKGVMCPFRVSGSIPLNPNRLRMRLRRQKQCRFRHGRNIDIRL